MKSLHKPRSAIVLHSYLVLLGMLTFSSTAIANNTPAIRDGNMDIFSSTTTIPATRTSTAIKEEKTNSKNHHVYISGTERLRMGEKIVIWVGILMYINLMVLE